MFEGTFFTCTTQFVIDAYTLTQLKSLIKKIVRISLNKFYMIKLVSKVRCIFAIPAI